jgi:hypothetical protein
MKGAASIDLIRGRDNYFHLGDEAQISQLVFNGQ